MIESLGSLLCALAGFAALALTMDGHAKSVLKRKLSARAKRIVQTAGWLLLAAALALGTARAWDIGIVLWTASLTVAGLLLVLALSGSSGRDSRRRANAQPGVNTAVRLTGRRAAIGIPLLVLPVGLGAVRLANEPPTPLRRADALRGNVGPWSFVFAEHDTKPPHEPEEGSSDEIVKTFVLQFCEPCDDQIRAAYLALRKPGSKSSGTPFPRVRGEREVEIPIPPGATHEDELWLTVEGQDATTHALRIELARVSPVTAELLGKRR